MYQLLYHFSMFVCLLICLLHLTFKFLFVSPVLNCPEHCLHLGSALWRAKHKHFVCLLCSKKKLKLNFCILFNVCTELIFRIEKCRDFVDIEHFRDRCEPMRMANPNLFIRLNHSAERFLWIDKETAWQCFIVLWGQYRFDPNKCQRHNTNCLNDKCNQSILLDEMKLIVRSEMLNEELSSVEKLADGRSKTIRK